MGLWTIDSWGLMAPQLNELLNVLLLLVDDLRPEVAGYGVSEAHTPRMDSLVASSTVFERAYCQQAICAPTRNSFLSGRRPQRTQAWNFLNHFREAGPDWLTLPQYFKLHNYTTLATGKSFHPGLPPNWDQPFSWSTDRPYVFAKNAYPKCARPDALPNSMVCPTDAADSEFSDYNNAVATLANLDYSLSLRPPRPFFLVFGAHRPHLPWNMPQRFWDMYPDPEHISLPTHQAAPRGMPPVAFTYEVDGQTRLRAFDEDVPVAYPDGACTMRMHHAHAPCTCAMRHVPCTMRMRHAQVPYPDGSTAPPANVTRTLRKGYMAAVSWTDHLIGMLLDALNARRVADHTLVALLGDVRQPVPPAPPRAAPCRPAHTC